ncbi:pentapeptide repeat-containing protein [Dactylosporangium siamense]|nr:pentapeptide repeat-containing protein [Dactylosporangium siamense]
MTAGVKALRQRWATPARQQLAAEAGARLRGGGRLNDLGLGVVDGLIDLRGVSFPGRTVQLDGCRLEGLALDAGDLTSFRFVDCTVVGCRFDRALCRDWRIWRTDFTDCSFVGADLRTSSLGAWLEGQARGNVYDHVRFTRAKMARLGSAAATYIDCDFSDADLTMVNFWQSSLIRCTFAGKVKQVVFNGRLMGEAKPDPNPMLDIDLAQARLEGTEFRWIDLSRTLLPQDPDLVLIENADMLVRANLLLRARGDVPEAGHAAEILRHFSSRLGSSGTSLLNLRDVSSCADLISEVLLGAGARRLG